MWRWVIDNERPDARVIVASESMDWVIAALSLNNIPDLDAAMASIRRVLKPQGRLGFTVPHPCFDAPDTDSHVSDSGHHRVVGRYLDEGFWRSSHPESVRRAGNYHRSISTYVMALISHRFRLEVLAEPAPDERVISANPHRAGLPPFLLICAARCSAG